MNPRDLVRVQNTFSFSPFLPILLGGSRRRVVAVTASESTYYFHTGRLRFPPWVKLSRHVRNRYPSGSPD